MNDMKLNTKKYSYMKKIIFIILFIFVIACENQPWSVPDYSLKAVYFPVQMPVRTLSMGEDRIDNSLDKQGKLDIGVVIGGMYSNNQDWTVEYKIDNTLLDSAYISSTYTKANKLYALPPSYYTLTPAPGQSVTIPSGSVNGLIRVELKDAFFNDPLSITGRYVIPLVLTKTSADSILQGKAIVPSPDIRKVNNWNANQSPKNWTMYGINYVNPYHGTWVHRCYDFTKSLKTGNDTTYIYKNKYVERDALMKLTTFARDTCLTNGINNKLGGNYSMKIAFSNDKGTPGNIVIKKSPTSTINVTGTGHYQDISTSKEKLIGLTVQSMYLNYTYFDGTYTHTVTDTLVFRDRGIKFTTNAIVIRPGV